jgi:hypothetical protein
MPESTIFEVNPEKPRSKAFNVFVSQGSEGEKMEVWDGRSKGPPRKDKFAEPSVILALINKALKAMK